MKAQELIMVPKQTNLAAKGPIVDMAHCLSTA